MALCPSGRSRLQVFLRSIPRRYFRPLPEGKTFDSQKGVLEFIDSHGTGAGAARNGRSWRTSELRLKSYEDLHRLWFLLLKERNMLLTEKAWCTTNRHHWENGESNLYKVKRSMARIKVVVGERIRAHRSLEGRQALREEKLGLQSLVGETDTPNESRGSGEVLDSKGEETESGERGSANDVDTSSSNTDNPIRKS
eukprot:GFKZ01010869.1.p1 GENE.GFKZ01010869.1~~GFKZ01010869.1.p1  ORF type:complete len:196 (-),score=14.43 GFKZ01010869.1:80-667(-)